MPEPRVIRVYYEGDDDRVLLEGLKVGRLIPDSLELVKRSKQQPGQDGLVHELAVSVRPSNGVAGSVVGKRLL